MHIHYAIIPIKTQDYGACLTPPPSKYLTRFDVFTSRILKTIVVGKRSCPSPLAMPLVVSDLPCQQFDSTVTVSAY